MSEREIRVERDGLFVKTSSSFKVLQKIIRARLILAAPKIKNVGIGITRCLGLNANLFLRRKRSPHRIGNAFCDFAFDSENIGQFPVVTLRPQMRIGIRLDQLDVDVDSVTRFLNTALKDICDPQFTSNLAKIVRRTLITCGGGARNNPESANPRECSNDFVLNALSEKGVLFV